jgi:uncharacterized membrane protein YdjX (TVP38/TMEM64 family)
MHPSTRHLHGALSWSELLPSVRAGAGVILLFAAGLWLARHYAEPIGAALAAHSALGIGVFFVSSAVAVLLPMLTNLPLVPLAVLAWGPWVSALILLLGWVTGAGLSFVLGRQARDTILRRFPSVQRHAEIDRLIHPQHRLLSLVMLRMTFPVDVLSYALGLFSRSTTLLENLTSTAIGGAPFAVLFALFPTLSGNAQWAVFGGSLLVFVLYAAWVLNRAEQASPPEKH